MSRLLGIATAVPPHIVTQEVAREFTGRVFGEAFPDMDRLLNVFDHGRIRKRHFAKPPEWYAEPHTFPESNAAWREAALELSAEAATSAPERSGVQAGEVGQVLFVSTTGIATPSLDAALIARIGLSRNTTRVPVWGLGCAGGVSGLARAAALARSHPGGPVLLVAVEVCSLTFQIHDLSKANLVGISLFADGAAAAVVGEVGTDEDQVQERAEGARERPALMGGFSTLFEDSEDVMGWDLTETGLRVRFSRHIPTIVRRDLPGELQAACAAWGIRREELRHFVAHPGGAKVLEAYAETLGLTEDQLAPAWEVLEQYGNLSSASVLFVLNRFLETTPPSGDLGVMLALGPGFSAEQLLFRW